MKIYVLTINEVGGTPDAIISSYRAQRYEKAKEYYASRSGADMRAKEIYEGLKKLVGFIGNIEVDIQERELNP